MKMRIYFLSMLASIGLILVGCSDDLGDGPGNEVLSGDKGYVKIAINLPTTSGQVTRSENDDFYDGSANEYKVNSVNLILFSGLSESKATFLESLAAESRILSAVPETAKKTASEEAVFLLSFNLRTRAPQKQRRRERRAWRAAGYPAGQRSAGENGYRGTFGYCPALRTNTRFCFRGKA